jgi:uncharacterized phiE125 gp8 family phage protein
MNLTVIIPPAVEPVTLDDVCDHLRIDDEEQKNAQAIMLTGLITAARMDAENKTGMAFVEQTLMLTTNHCRNFIELLRSPVIEIESVSYYDVNNVAVEIDAANYYHIAGPVGRVAFVWGFAYPTLYTRPDAFSVRYRAGYQATSSPVTDYAENVPQPIRQAILLGVQVLYGGLTPQEQEATEKARDALLSTYVVHSIA